MNTPEVTTYTPPALRYLSAEAFHVRTTYRYAKRWHRLLALLRLKPPARAAIEEASRE